MNRTYKTLGTILVNEVYENKTPKEIAEDLASKYTWPIGVVVREWPDKPVRSATFRYMHLQEAFSRLAIYANGYASYEDTELGGMVVYYYCPTNNA